MRCHPAFYHLKVVVENNKIKVSKWPCFIRTIASKTFISECPLKMLAACVAEIPSKPPVPAKVLPRSCDNQGAKAIHIWIPSWERFMSG